MDSIYKRILVAIDGSATGQRGLKEAIDIAAETGARLRIIHVVGESILAYADAGMSARAVISQFVEAGNTILKMALEAAKQRGVAAETALHEDLRARVSEIIVQDAKAWNAELIVLGTHGRRGLRRAALGSDAEAVVRNAPAPVLLIRYDASKNRAGSRSDLQQEATLPA
jgi:nucleotide-binding universal stress UspA family protein